MATPFSAAIVDDRLRDLGLVKTNLQKIKNCSILFTHTNPYHFFEHLNTTRYLPDIVITDCQMPDMDGMALTLLVHLFLPQVKTIVVSGLRTETDVADALDADVDDVIVKGSLQYHPLYRPKNS